MASSASGEVTSVETTRTEPGWAGPGFVEFVALMALMMGLTAITIDSFLPAFPAIQGDFAVQDPNRLQLLVYVYMLGFGIAQLFYGPVSDGTGRRPALIAGIGIYLAGTVLAMLAPSFEVLLLARAIQGIGGAAGRVLAVAIVRDRYEGRDMARVMSFCMMVFLIVPILAPSMGGAILLFGSWRLIFGAMLALALVTLAWFGTRLPETLHPAFRRPVSARAIGSGIAVTVGTRTSLGYATALGLTTGCIMGYVGSAQAIFDTGLYHLGALFPVAFALIAGAMGVATLINARLVRRLGMRRLAHMGTVGLFAVACLQLVLMLAFGGTPPVWLLIATLSACQFLMSFAMPNFNALAMEPLAAIAGTASSFIGFYTTLLAAFCGLLVGQSFDGTVTPLAVGYCALSGLALATVLWTERGRLFGAGAR
ncbi:MULTISPECIES: multidrug effflux MFS transporter [Methylobacterium]|uniref:multidrug effflux MFS transporter n=1 Tax=Methylobacterium TaxID=407 RepID=UPI0008E564B9|nr:MULTISPECIES: multidrug effflux MFS transporter [Methylobacterium]MBZ6412300.1 multidrug effflux MFS transporter [Methylobacterium sp.]MBK3400623.1 multidrug effflux MFS transporter [Methylobacterium ajmalii]MBK3407040.1 multidrug effflux MFS transporter [Methylobacterium ajmalii]MBK3424925.1 multidrug effflux MFS transporter [Methylobacterium ajmalii]SFE72364.1 MFS transporter, DHA1 family, bicyclomycin/chloramphenicol resistance protein [Methylobacterium sp. yr596]